MSSSTTPIAIIGVSAEFPSGEHDHNLDYADYWRFLLHKGEAFSPIPSDRFNYEAFSHLITPNSGAFLTQPTLFDSLEFGIPPADAAALPLATRKLIEHAFLALRDAGINYRGADVGVYTAGVGHDASVLGEADPHALTGTFAAIPATIANRVSYHLDLHGPSLPVDTACSSSLTATHLAVQALRAGECESAVVGGAQINLRLNEWIQYSQSGVLSKDGKCKPFDANADGFARGEGVACIILKPLDKAIKDGDRVYATILGSAINAAGSQAPLNAPVAAAQQAAMTRAYTRAGKNPMEVDFVEMHATGTAVGDPTEANWVGEQFKREDGGPLFAGSVKGNLGHTEITAFLASLLKVTHMVEHNIIPPTANFSVPNRKIHWEEFNLHVPSTAPIPFTPRAPSGKALISLSSFGIGGANGHVVLEGPAPRSQNAFGRYDRHGDSTDAILIMAGGLSPRSAGVMAEQIRELFMNAPRDSLPLLAKLAGRQARQLTWRSYALYYPNLEVSKALTFCEAQLAPRTRPPLAFVFSGQGPQHALMGRQLFSKYPAFRKSVHECDEAYRSVMGFSLVESSGLFVEPRDNATSSKPAVSSEWTVTLPALTILQIALFDLLASFGIKPDVVLGHSAGETALLYASGAGPKEMAVEVAIARAKMMSVAESVGGGMAAVACGEVEAQGLIDEILAKEGIFEQAEREQSLVLACYNSPDGVSVAGLVGLVDKLCALAESRGVLARRLRIPVPVHSYLMDVCKDQCESRVGEVFARFPQAGKPTTTMYSTVTGLKWDEPFSVDYFWRNARQAVLFNQVTTQLVDEHPNMCYVEISPHPVLSSYISSAGVDGSRITCPSRRPAKSGEFLEGAAFLESLGRLAMNGYDVDFNALNNHPEWDPKVKLPAYPFSKKDVPFHADTPSFHRLLLARNGPLNHPRLRINAKTHPLLAGHVVNSEPIMPAAGFIEMALEFGARVLSDVEFMAALPLSAEVPSTVEVALDGAKWSVKTSSALGHGSDKSWAHRGSPDFDRLHSRGLLTFNTDNTDDEPLDLAAIQTRCKRVCRIEDLYEHGFKGFADYSSDFRRITYAVQGEDEVFVTLRGAIDLADCDKYRFDPVILDAVFHGCMFFIMEHEQVILDYETRDYFLPSRAARVVLHDALARASLPEQIAAHFVLRDWTPAGVSVDISITDIAGERLCTIRGFEMTRHSNSIHKAVEKRFQLEWQPVSIPLQPANELHHILIEEFVYLPDPLFNYSRGQEMKLRDELAGLDASDSLCVWIVATDGPDGDAARGLTRTLGKELPAWSIHLVICDASWSMQKRRAAIAKLQDNPAIEPEVRLDINGAIHVPRVVPLPSPSLEAPFESDKHWVTGDDKVSLAALPALGPFDIAVEVSHWSSLNKDSPQAFIATVSNKGTSDFATGDWVMGLTDAPFSNRLVVHGGSVVPCQPNDSRVLPDAAGLASAVLALGPGTLRRMGRLQAIQHVLVTNADTLIGQAAARLYVHLGLDVFCIAEGDAEALAKSIQVPRCRYDVVLSGARSKPDVQAVTQLCTPQGILHLWNSESDGLLSNLKRDPWLAAFALEVALQNIPNDFCSYTSPVAIADVAPVADGTLVATQSSLFDPRKTYILVGGIGGMGIQMALWMYENGARDIVLTSRRGRESLRRTNQTAGLRTVQYLERRPDLSLSLEAVDATDYEATAALIKSLQKPIGGCFLMSLVLSDKSFANQTEDDFEKVFDAKTTAFQNLSHALDINTLDFFVSFSSVAALFGSAGQSNYTSASSALEGMTNGYRNAFSLVVPGITDSGWLVRDQRGGENSRSSHLLEWGMSTRELCDCIADGIRKLQTGSFHHYVPNLNWNLVRQDMGALPSFQHLCVAERTEAATLEDGEEDSNLEELVRTALNIPAEDFSPHVPFTAYGLDSLVAVRLSAAIRANTGLKVSQLQLLADMTLEDLERRLEDILLDADLE
ncbi:ketoacyl-synt-domain-containing protein [Hysterangium stoloniferum]|nr:ketoacyl-synt-domain-containing protein [Hysterangium stoloniferum]